MRRVLIAVLIVALAVGFVSMPALADGATPVYGLTNDGLDQTVYPGEFGVGDDVAPVFVVVNDNGDIEIICTAFNRNVPARKEDSRLSDDSKPISLTTVHTGKHVPSKDE